MMRRYSTLLTFLLVSLASQAFSAERPNFLIILADDVGRDAIGCYGGESYQTSEIDALATAGMRFDHAYVMPVCHPTRTTLLSGRYPSRQGRPNWGSYPREEEDLTFAAQLRSAGYATAIAGKWQLGLLKEDTAQPRRMGFDQSSLFGWHEGPRYWNPLIYQNGSIRTDIADRYGPDVYVEFLQQFMTEHQDVPFLAFYSMALCHDVTDDLEEPVPYGPGRDRYESYGEMVATMDERVGRIVQAVDDLGLTEQTMVLFLGDNGTARRSIARAVDGKFVREPVVSQTTAGPVRGGKGQMTDAGTRVPWIVRWPGTVPAGTTTEALVDASDLLPTLLDLAGVKPAKYVELDGRSFTETLTDPQQNAREWVHVELKQKSYVADRRWKLMSDGKLFDRESDPKETLPVTEDSPESRAAHGRLNRVAAQLPSAK